MTKTKLGGTFTNNLISSNSANSNTRIGGAFTVECYDKFNTLKWVERTHNLVTNQGLNRLLNVMFGGITATATWYVALFESNTTPASDLTYAVPSYTECTAYDETTREAYVEATTTTKSMTNAASKAEFTMNATKTIYGASIVSATTKADTATAGAVLYCAAKFTAERAVYDDDVLRVTYVLGAADDGA